MCFNIVGVRLRKMKLVLKHKGMFFKNTSILMAADFLGAGALSNFADSSLALALSASALAHFSLVRVSNNTLRSFLRSSGNTLPVDKDEVIAINASILGAGCSDQDFSSSISAPETSANFSSPSR